MTSLHDAQSGIAAARHLIRLCQRGEGDGTCLQRLSAAGRNLQTVEEFLDERDELPREPDEHALRYARACGIVPLLDVLVSRLTVLSQHSQVVTSNSIRCIADDCLRVLAEARDQVTVPTRAAVETRDGSDLADAKRIGREQQALREPEDAEPEQHDGGMI